MAQTPSSAANGRGKPTTAAAIFLVAFAFSASLMAWSGYQLYRGEQLAVAMTATGQRCEWLVYVDEPQQVQSVVATLLAEPAAELPAAATAYLAELAPLATGKALAGTQPWSLCGVGTGAVLTVPARDADGQPVAESAWQQLAARWAQRSATGGIAWQRAEVHADGPVLRVVLAADGTDPAALLQRARPEAPDRHLGSDLAFRAALERVGAGAVHLYLPQAQAQAWLRRTISAAWTQSGIETVEWLGVGVRLDREGPQQARVRIHGHLGGGQQMGAWMKESFDIAAMEDVSGWIAPKAQAAAVLRVPAAARSRLAGWYGPQTPLFQALLACPDARLPVSTVVWQRFAPGDEALLWKGHGDGPEGFLHTSVAGWQVVATTDAARAQALRLTDGKSGGDPEGRDRQRLLDTTQGWYSGATQVDWVWTDMGLAAEYARQVPLR